MKRFALLPIMILALSLSLHGQSSITLLVGNYNTVLLGLLQGAGLVASSIQPSVQVIVVDPVGADGYRVLLNCTRPDGSTFSSQIDTAATGHSTIYYFPVDCTSVSQVTALPYRTTGPPASWGAVNGQ